MDGCIRVYVRAGRGEYWPICMDIEPTFCRHFYRQFNQYYYLLFYSDQTRAITSGNLACHGIKFVHPTYMSIVYNSYTVRYPTNNTLEHCSHRPLKGIWRTRPSEAMHHTC